MKIRKPLTQEEIRQILAAACGAESVDYVVLRVDEQTLAVEAEVDTTVEGLRRAARKWAPKP